MNCAELQRWFDDGLPSDGEYQALAHAAKCEACARELNAARVLDAVLLGAPVTAPAHFTDGVMRRVEASRVLSMKVPVLAPTMPWWVRVAAQPATALALVVAGLLIWRFDLVIAAVQTSATWLAGLVHSVSSQGGPSSFQKLAQALPASAWMSIALAIGPLLPFAVLPLYRWVEKVSEAQARPRGHMRAAA